MSAADGREKRAVAEKMLSADRVVGVARLAIIWRCYRCSTRRSPPLASHSTRPFVPSISSLARELQHTGLEEQATRFTLASLDAVEAEAEYWHELLQATRNTLRLLRTATLTNPLLSASGRSGAPPLGAEVACSAGVSSWRWSGESLAELHERQKPTRRSGKRSSRPPPRLQQGLDATTVAASATGAQHKVVRLLHRQADRIRCVEEYLAKQERAFAALLDDASCSDPGAHAERGGVEGSILDERAQPLRGAAPRKRRASCRAMSGASYQRAMQSPCRLALRSTCRSMVLATARTHPTCVATARVDRGARWLLRISVSRATQPSLSSITPRPPHSVAHEGRASASPPRHPTRHIRVRCARPSRLACLSGWPTCALMCNLPRRHEEL